jgi:hypothetical protein
VSEEAKEHSRQVIDEIEASGEADDVRERYDAEGGKDQTRVLAGHKATLKSEWVARLLRLPCMSLMRTRRRPERQRGGQGALAPGPRGRGRDLNFPSVGALSLSLWAASPGPRATSNACKHVPLRSNPHRGTHRSSGICLLPAFAHIVCLRHPHTNPHEGSATPPRAT